MPKESEIDIISSILSLNVFTCMCVGMCASVQMPRETLALASPELELQMVVIILIWVRGSRLGPQEEFTV